jgi:hypothetical protein
MKTTRIRAGLYEVATAAGAWKVERVELAPEHHGRGLATASWYVTPPGEVVPTDSYATLADAKADIEAAR